MPPLSERKASLIGFAQNEVKQITAGDLDQISTIHELADKFDYPPKTVSVYLSNADVGKQRKALDMDTRRKDILVVSREWAWMLGVLAGGGNVGAQSGSISVGGSRPEILEQFKLTGENLFGKNAAREEISNTKRNYTQIIFYTKIIPSIIGDLRHNQWVNSIRDNHSWITVDQNYTWSFIEGYFERRGSIDVNPRSRDMRLASNFLPAANFLTELLMRNGIENPYLCHPQKNSDIVSGVGIANIRDLRLFAENVHSVDPAKEVKLNYLRTLRSERSLPSKRNQVNSHEEVIAEWRRMYDKLGHPPNITDITELYELGETRWSANVYARVFGRTGTIEGRSYNVALSRLAAACGIESIAQAALRYRRPVSKYKDIQDPTELISQYKELRDKTLQDRGRLPVTQDFEKARKAGLINYSRVTFANYFGDGSLTKAIRQLEDLISTSES